jgi:ribose 5-phosphate isomerase A
MSVEALAQLKEQAALSAVAAEVRDGMIVGLGTGTTVAFVLRELGRRIRDTRWRITGVPTSERTATQARRLGIPLTTLDATPDVALDGADQIDPTLNLVKGGGGALVREKIVALAARRLVVVADHTKAVARLHGPVPLEVLPFALPWVMRALPDLVPDGRPQVRLVDGRPYRSDNQNVIVDLVCQALGDARAVAATLDGLSGVVDHGLFIGIAAVAYVAGPDGVRVLARAA